jgi:cysteinyl-tRNA synthetase
MRWPSPWGDGYPGWHIECSAMAGMLLGEEIDLHSGGEDNIFPHHECEIAQSCCASGRPTFARVWFHTRHLQVEGAKMSKSRGNFLTARQLFDRGVTPGALRLELIRSHYRNNSNFTLQGVNDCQRMIDRWSRCRAALVARCESSGTSEPPDAPPGPLERGLAPFVDALCDDMNIARAIAVLNESVAIDASGSSASREVASLLAMDSVIGVLGRNQSIASFPGSDEDFLAKVRLLLDRRADARLAKDWIESDRIRDQLRSLGVEVADLGPDGQQVWKRT